MWAHGFVSCTGNQVNNLVLCIPNVITAVNGCYSLSLITTQWHLGNTEDICQAQWVGLQFHLFVNNDFESQLCWLTERHQRHRKILLAIVLLKMKTDFKLNCLSAVLPSSKVQMRRVHGSNCLCLYGHEWGLCHRWFVWTWCLPHLPFLISLLLSPPHPTPPLLSPPSQMCCDCCLLGKAAQEIGLACDHSLSVGYQCGLVSRACCTHGNPDVEGNSTQAEDGQPNDSLTDTQG